MTSDSDTIAVESVEGYPSLTALRDAHGTLLEQRRTHGDTPELLVAAERLIQRGVATGALLDGSEDRRAAQSLLNYWANLLYRAGRAPLDATLADFDPLLAPALAEALCPYLGLDAFSEASAARFFGRQELVARMLERLGEQRLLAVVGPSGSGKSSVVRAGLLPTLRGGALPGSETWRYLPPIVPGSDPLASLGLALGTDDGRRATDEPAEQDAPMVLVVDQFEEVFTLCEDGANRQAFITNLLALASARAQRVILTMRSDFETLVARLPELQPVFERGRVQVTPLSAAELREAIEAPAAQVGLKFEQGVVDLLLQDILGEPAGLPLLQFTLLKLWEQRERNRVTRAAYERVGGGRLALARSADAFYQSLIPEEQVTARRILLRMVRPGEGLEITSNRVRRSALTQGGEDPGRVERVLSRLVDAHLVRLTAAETPDDDQVEVAHEALVRNWPTLVDWLEEEKAAIATRRRLESRAAEWTRLGRGDAGLLDEVEWREAERWLQSAEAQYLGYDAALPAFIAASRTATERAVREHEAAHQRELEQARALGEAQQKLAEAQARTARRLRRAALALIVLLVLALLAAGYAFIQRNIAQTAEASALGDANARATAQSQAQHEAATARTAEASAQVAQATAEAAKADADQQRETVDAQRLAFAARTQFDAAPETALLLASEAAKRQANPITEQTLRDAIDSNSWRSTILQGHTGPVKSAVFNEDDSLILTASDDNTARLWDASGREIAILRGHTKAVNDAVFSEDGTRILTASDDNTARLWDASGHEIRTLRGDTNRIRSVAFSPDGTHILTTSDDHTAKLWDAQGNFLVNLEHGDSVTGGMFNPHDSKSVLTISDDKTARLWSLEGHLLAVLDHDSGMVLSGVFSLDGRRILTASSDAKFRLWEVTDQPFVVKQLAVISAHTDWVTSAVFRPDGQAILTGSHDRTVRIWDAGGGPLATLTGHTDWVTGAVFRSDWQAILTSSYDHTARLWDGTGHPLATLAGHTDWVFSAVFSHNGQRILTASKDGTARLWDPNNQPLATLQGHTDQVSNAAYSLDGQYMLTASHDGSARLWNLNGKLLATFSGHTGWVNSTEFSPDRQHILTASDDKTVRVWDLTDKEFTGFQAHPKRVISAQFSPDGQRIVTASADKTARVWNLQGRLLTTLQGHTDAVYSAQFSPDGQRILTASRDTTARVWDLSGKQLATLQGVSSAVFSPDGQRILTTSDDNSARVWDLSGKQLATLQGVTSAVFSPDGQRIVTASADRTARVWDLSGKQLATLQGHTDAVYSAVFSPDGQRILTASADKTARQYLVHIEDLLAVAACRVGRGLTQEEIKRFDVGTPSFDFEKRRCPPVLGAK